MKKCVLEVYKLDMTLIPLLIRQYGHLIVDGAVVRVGGDLCIVHFAAAATNTERVPQNTERVPQNAGAEQTLLKHMLIFPPHGAKP